jgi:hypothetical protein
MFITISTILLILLGGFGIVYFMGRDAAVSKKARGGKEKPADKRWYAVAIEPGPKACAAIKAMSDKPYLMSEAPTLPLSNCVANCSCRYRHMEDRRQDNRRAPFSENSAFANATGYNRRNGPGRRRTDRLVYR